MCVCVLVCMLLFVCVLGVNDVVHMCCLCVCDAGWFVFSVIWFILMCACVCVCCVCWCVFVVCLSHVFGYVCL